MKVGIKASSECRREILSSLNLSLSSISSTSMVAKYTPVRYSSQLISPVVVILVVTAKLSSNCLGGLLICLALGGETDMSHFSANDTATSHSLPLYLTLSYLKSPW